MPPPLLQPRASREPRGDGKSAPGVSPVLAWGALCNLCPPSMAGVARRGASCEQKTQVVRPQDERPWYQIL